VLGLTPLVVVFALLLVALLLAPAVLRLVAERRFPALERRGPDSVLGSLAWSLGHTVLALLALVVSLPLWLVPPLILIVPPLIWGWLTYRVMSSMRWPCTPAPASAAPCCASTARRCWSSASSAATWARRRPWCGPP
jgi:hypothetical protein